jgi:hypothetical protein
MGGKLPPTPQGKIIGITSKIVKLEILMKRPLFEVYVSG